MIGYCSIKGVGQDFNTLTLVWRVKEIRNKKRKIKGLKVYLDERELARLGEPTRIKMDLLVSQLVSFNHLNKFDTELDLELFVNSFILDYSPAILFLGKRHFKKIHMSDDSYVKPEATLIDKKYMSRKRKEQMMTLLEDARDK